MRSIALFFVLGTALISSCISNQYDRSPIQKQKDYVVVLETHKSGQSMEYAHPVHLDVQAVKEMLGSFTYARKEGVFDKKGSEPVFQQKEIDRLAQPLASALAKSGSSQHVRFVSLNKKKSLKVMTTYYQTEGILFRDSDSRINFAFIEINDRVSSEDPISLVAEFSGKDPMQVTKSEVKLTSELSLFQHYVSSEGKTFPVWMTAAAGKTKNQETMSKKPDVQDQKPSVTEQTRQANPPAVADGMGVQKEIKEKLKYLKELLDEGLISESDYNAKKKMLLDKLN